MIAEMRSILAWLGLVIFAPSIFAQVQEKKLSDRLLQPDMSLTNSAQDKEFNPVAGPPVDRQFVAKSFYSGDQATTKSFAGGKGLSLSKFHAQKFSRSDVTANPTASTRIAPNPDTPFATKNSTLVRPAIAAEKAVYAHDYPDNRPFLATGTRQKTLSQQDKPLTIDEVRELLNKNK